MHARRRADKVQTTLRVPKPLYEQARACVKQGVTTARTINDFFVAAIDAYTKILRRKRIDREFARMAEDANYQQEAQLVAEEFSHSDWEALEAAEESLREGTNAAR